MRRRVMAAGILVAGLAVAGYGQEPAKPSMTVVTSEWPLKLQAWRPSAKGFDRVWQAKPREVDPASWPKRRSDQIGNPRGAAPVIADIDGDGVNELLVMDTFGITAYGRTPAYYPFPRAGIPSAPAPLVVADVDGDRKPEFVTYRALDGDSQGVEVFRMAAEGLETVWRQPHPLDDPGGYVLAVGDVDNDGTPEILAGSTVRVFKRRAPDTWEPSVLVPNLSTFVDDVAVADVDGDGNNEIVLGGNGGKVTVYRHMKYSEKDLEGYPVVWQSRYLLADGLKGVRDGVRPWTFVAAVAIADVTGDGRPDILAATSSYGALGDRKISGGGRIHVFTADGEKDFREHWVSDFTKRASVHALCVADLDGDTRPEIMLNGDVFTRNAEGSGFTPAPSLSESFGALAVGVLPELREPDTRVRVTPSFWTAGLEMGEGEVQDVRFTLFAPWAEARDVTISVRSRDGRFAVENGTLSVAHVPAGGSVESPRFTLRAIPGKDGGTLEAEIVASGGYRQTVPLPLRIGDPFPSYDRDVPARLAAAMALARDDNRRVLIQWGSGSDQASQNLIRTLAKNVTVSQTVQYEYVVVRAEVKGNEKLAARYKAPVSSGIPVLTVLDAEGRILANQPAAPFAAGGDNAAAFDGAKLNEFLTKFKPAYVQADAVLKAALATAKKEQKTLFVWFSAPW